jgi:hypothetical protein
MRAPFRAELIMSNAPTPPRDPSALGPQPADPEETPARVLRSALRLAHQAFIVRLGALHAADTARAQRGALAGSFTSASYPFLVGLSLGRALQRRIAEVGGFIAFPAESAPVQLLESELHALQFVHGHTEVFGIPDDALGLQPFGASHHGTTTWSTSPRRAPGIHLAWDWVRLRDDVVMLSDPLDVRADVELTDSHGYRLSRRYTLIALNRVIHGLDWHDTVRAACGARAHSASR